MLQADFVLTASRGDIVEANLWNKELVSRAVGAFVESVTVFNRTGVCKYDWPRYLSAGSDANGTIMEDLIPRLRRQMKNEYVLETQTGIYRKPSSVVLVPDHFTDGGTSSRPLLDDYDDFFTYVAVRYNPADLRTLGVNYQTTAEFHRMLSSKAFGWIKARGSTWHSRLAAAIVRTGYSYFWIMHLIPLRDGRWVSANEGPIYFPNTSVDDIIPEGIEVNIIDEIACADESRREMFSLFGAQILTQKQICNLILDRHRSLTFLTDSVTLGCLISHAWYLFSFGSASLDCGSLKLATQRRHSDLSAGHGLYMDLPGGSFQMRDNFLDGDSPCKFLHSDYLTHGSSSQRTFWHEWLQHKVGVSTLPRIIKDGAFWPDISPELQYLIGRRPSRVWLTLLRDNWSYYDSDILRVSNTLGSVLVDCKSGRKCRLQDTYLATSAVMRETLAAERLSIVDISDPNHRGWLNVRILGLHTTQDLNFFLSILLSITKTGPIIFAQATMTRLYQGIERHFDEDPEAARYVQKY